MRYRYALDDPPVSEHLSRNIRLAILSPGVLVCASAVRLLIIANYDPTTASSIASSSGVVGTLLGTLVPVVPQFLPMLVLLLLTLRRPLLLLFSVVGTVLVSPTYATPKSALVQTSNRFHQVWYALNLNSGALKHKELVNDWNRDRPSLIFALIVILIFIIDKRALMARLVIVKDQQGKKILEVLEMLVRGLFSLVPAAIVAVLLAGVTLFINTIYHIPLNKATISAIASKPWLPSEEVKLNTGKIVVGYTLHTDDIWYVFLLQRTRSIDYFREDQVQNRMLCRLPGQERPVRPPMIQLVNLPAPLVAPCPRDS